jgi:hypothetical protein
MMIPPPRPPLHHFIYWLLPLQQAIPIVLVITHSYPSIIEI